MASSGLAMIFPPLIHILTYWNQQRSLTIEGALNGGARPTRSQRSAASVLPKPLWVAKDIAIMTLGVVGCAFGTYAALHSIVLYFESNGNEDYCTSSTNDTSSVHLFKTYCHLV